ncbi:unnamed protein product [Rotaria socialis]
MTVVPSVIVLLFFAFITYPTICESLKCYECAGKKSCGGQGHTNHIVECAGKCMIYQNVDDDDGVIVRSCCLNNCNSENRPNTYFCSKDRCNSIDLDSKFLATKNNAHQKQVHLRAKIEEKNSSLQCFDCSSHKSDCAVDETTLVEKCQACMVYLNQIDTNNVVRRCCKSNCGAPGTIRNHHGRRTYFCTSDQCNGIGSEKVLTGKVELENTNVVRLLLSKMETTTATISTTTPAKTVFQCYECSGPSCGKGDSSVSTNCPSCMVYRNPNDQTIIERRCCWWACGASNTVSTYNGLETYFCADDKCNGYGTESTLTPAVTTTTVSTTSVKTIFQCYECSGPSCGKADSPVSTNCPSCMVYRNPNDPSIIERRCCWWACGASNTVSTYNGIETYFCADDKCNGYGAESTLTPPVTTTTERTTTTTTISTTPAKTIFQCYDCSGPSCGKDDSSISTNCPSCMVYRNPNDKTIIERRCCWWACGPSNSVSTYNGLETYFCTADKCNGYGAEFALSPAGTTTTTTTTTMQTSVSITTPATTSTTITTATTSTTITTTITTTTIGITTTTTAEKTSFQCYDCSGQECGRDGSSVSSNCPRCMVYRNPNDQTIIERRCCWWACGTSNTVSSYNGIETYFCAADKCNGYGSEFALGPPVTTTTTTTTKTTPSTSTTSISITSGIRTTTITATSSPHCILNCRNGGTPETEDGCFCYCLENTFGRECENVDCAKPDADSEVCSTENQPLCQESEEFALECHHLCGKC